MKLIGNIIVKFFVLCAIPFTVLIYVIIFLCKCVSSVFYSIKEEELYSEKECKQRRLNRAEKRTDEFFNLTATALKSLFD